MKTFLNSIKIIGIAAVLAVGVSYVSAFTSNGAPTPAGNPTNNVPSPVNIGSLLQTKIGSFTTESFLKAGTNTTPGTPGWIIAANAAGSADNGGTASLWQFFQKEYLPGIKSQMKVGSPNPGRTATPLPSVDKTKFNPKDASIPLTIDLIDRGASNNSEAGTQVMDLLAGDVCNNATTVQTNTAGIQFWSTKNINPNTNTAGDNADVIARGIQIGDSSAGAMKVLVATDTSGNAVWGTMRIANGQVVVDYPGSSDVAAGQACGVAQSICTDPTASNYNQTGTCTYAVNCPAGQYASGGVCLCSGGIREDQTPITNVQTTGKIIQYINSVNQNVGGGGAPIVPYYIMLDELRRNGGPGDDCKIVAWDTACPAFDLDTMEGQFGVPVTSFTFDGITYQTTGGNPWEIDSDIGDQCIMHRFAQVGNEDLIMYNITP